MKRLSVTFGCDTPLFLVGQKIKCSQQQHVWNRIPYTVLSHQLSNSAFFKKSMSVSATFACKFSLLASQPKRFAKYIMQQAVCGDDATLQQSVIFQGKIGSIASHVIDREIAHLTSGRYALFMPEPASGYVHCLFMRFFCPPQEIRIVVIDKITFVHQSDLVKNCFPNQHETGWGIGDPSWPVVLSPILLSHAFVCSRSIIVCKMASCLPNEIRSVIINFGNGHICIRFNRSDVYFFQSIGLQNNVVVRKQHVFATLCQCSDDPDIVSLGYSPVFRLRDDLRAKTNRCGEFPGPIQ